MYNPAENDDWHYVYSERLAILCGNGVPTDAQKAIARAEADEYVSQRKYDL